MQHLPTHAAESNQTGTTTSLALAQNLAVFWQIKSFYLNYRLESIGKMTRKYVVPPVFTPSYGRKWWHCWPGCVHKLSTHLEFSVSAGEMPSSRCAMLFLFRIRTCVQLVGVQQKSNAPWWWLFVISIWFLLFFFTAVSNPHNKFDNHNQRSRTDKGVTGC